MTTNVRVQSIDIEDLKPWLQLLAPVLRAIAEQTQRPAVRALLLSAAKIMEMIAARQQRASGDMAGDEDLLPITDEELRKQLGPDADLLKGTFG